MLGYFGKNQMVTPSPAPSETSAKSVPAATARIAISPSPSPPSLPPPPTPQPRPAPIEQKPEPSEIEIQLSQLRQSVEAKRLGKEREVQAVQEMQRKQADYGRDTKQIKPREAGYSTEAEKIMGGGTGYYAKPTPLSGLGYLSATTAEVTAVSGEVTRLTNIVKQLTKDVEAGMVPRSELARAIAQLQEKSQEAKVLTSQLSGLGDALDMSPSYPIVWKIGRLLLLSLAAYGTYSLIKPHLAGSVMRPKKRRKR